MPLIVADVFSGSPHSKESSAASGGIRRSAGEALSEFGQVEAPVVVTTSMPPRTKYGMLELNIAAIENTLADENDPSAE
jgi:hypothetical protein